MSIKKISYIQCIAIIICYSNLPLSLLVAMDIHATRKPFAFYQHNNHGIDITLERLGNDKGYIKKYVTERVATDLKKAKRWGKGMAKAFGGISSYVFDAIPFEFFSDNAAIDEAFKHFEEGVDYIRELKETFKKNMPSHKKKINQSQLAEFLYGHIVDKLNITDAQRALLKREPIRMDEFVRKGIVKRSEYMYYTLLNFAVRYYLEQELKNR